MNSLEQVAQAIAKRNNFLLLSHTMPDGDSIGSLLGMYQGLKNMGKEVSMFMQDPVPAMYRYLKGSDKVMLPGQFKGGIENVIFLDCADEERVGEAALEMLGSRRFTINIDHHMSNTLFGDINYIQPQAAATAELVYSLLKMMQIEIDPPLANALYAAIVQDTGSFHHSNTTAGTFRTAADLLDCGVQLDVTRVQLFESKSRVEICLLGRALNSIQFTTDGKIAWMTLTYQDVESLDALDAHPEGIINHTLMVKGVEVGLLFREIAPGQIKVGFRSKGMADVSALAVLFGGGGHRQAAGASMLGTMEECQRKVIEAVRGVIS